MIGKVVFPDYVGYIAVYVLVGVIRSSYTVCIICSIVDHNDNMGCLPYYVIGNPIPNMKN